MNKACQSGDEGGKREEEGGRCKQLPADNGREEKGGDLKASGAYRLKEKTTI